MKMTKDVADMLVTIHNTLMGVETKGAASMAVVDSVRALERLVQSSDYIVEDSAQVDEMELLEEEDGS